MSQVIYKYAIPMDGRDRFVLELFQDAEILCVHRQNGCLQLWALGNPKMNIVPRLFVLFGTGTPIPDYIDGYEPNYVDTFFQGEYVWHIFEVK